MQVFQKAVRKFHRAATEDKSEPSTTNVEEGDEDVLLIERQISSSKRKRNSRDMDQGPKVISPVVDQVYGQKPLTPAQQAESKAVLILGLLFSLIILEGIFLAGSGFLSEGIDDFAAKYVYPAFSPTVVVFLSGSTAYGLWKTGGLNKKDG